jgi:uncharacterized protein (TIGR03437 family)
VALIRPGDIAFLGMRTGAAGPVSAAYCTGCTFRNITAYSSVEWGLANLGSQSSVYERTYSIPRPGTDRLASTYGQPELGAAGPGNQVRLNRMIRTMDNGIPMAADSLGTVKSQTDSRTLVVEGALSTWLQLGGAVPDGSAVMFQRPSDGSLLGTARIVSQNAPPFTGQDPYSVTYTFDRDLPAAVVGSVMQGLDPSQRAANTVIERNALEEETDCCRGFLLGGMVDSVVRGNYIQGAPMAALHIENALYHDFLSPPVENFTISNNVIDHTNWTATGFPYYQLGAIEVVTAKSNVAPAAAGAHQNVAVSGNFIADSGTPAVWMGNTSGGSVSGNYFLTPNNNPAVTATVAAIGATQPVVLAGSANVAAAGNTVDQTSGRVWITDASYRKLAAYAPGGVVRLNAYEIGTLGTPSVTLTDADGRTAPAPVQSSSAHSIDVLVPATAALGGAYLTLAAGGLKYFGTLFVDDRDNVPALNGCTYDLSPAATSVGAAAGNLAVLVVTQADCAYNVTAAGGFARAGAGGAGTGVVSVALSSNSGADRVVAIEVAGQQFSATQTAPSGARPVVKSIYDAWNYTAGIAPGAWVTLTGTAMAAGPPRTWNLSGAQRLPTTLGGVTVSFNGLPAALYYVSDTQINALAPSGVAPGPVQVVVQSNGIAGAPFAATAAVAQPAIYGLPSPDGGTLFVTAALAGTATLVGNSAADPRVARAALPGDILDLYLIGLGATADPAKFLTDQPFAGAFEVAATVTASIGGEPAPVSFAGLITPGLYLVRVAVPSRLAPGPQPVQISAGGVKTRPALALLIGAAP